MNLREQGGNMWVTGMRKLKGIWCNRILISKLYESIELDNYLPGYMPTTRHFVCIPRPDWPVSVLKHRVVCTKCWCCNLSLVLTPHSGSRYMPDPLAYSLASSSYLLSFFSLAIRAFALSDCIVFWPVWLLLLRGLGFFFVFFFVFLVFFFVCLFVFRRKKWRGR